MLRAVYVYEQQGCGGPGHAAVGEGGGESQRQGRSCRALALLDWAQVDADTASSYMKMEHSEIEQVMFGIVCEAWELMHKGLGMDLDEISEIRTRWEKER